MKKFLIVLLLVLGLAFTAQAKNITLSADNTLILSDVFTEDSVTQIMDRAAKLDSNLKSGYPLYLFMYTPGGYIQSGIELIEYLKGLNRPVHTITLFSASMGFQVVQHLGKRYVLKYGTLMSHKARGTFSGEFGGTLSQLESRVNMWLRKIKIMDMVTVKRTKGKQTWYSYTKAYAPELWLVGKEAVTQGYADAVVQVKCDDSLQKSYT